MVIVGEYALALEKEGRCAVRFGQSSQETNCRLRRTEADRVFRIGIACSARPIDSNDSRTDTGTSSLVLPQNIGRMEILKPTLSGGTHSRTTNQRPRLLPRLHLLFPRVLQIALTLLAVVMHGSKTNCSKPSSTAKPPAAGRRAVPHNLISLY